jgi:hypothetical protein
MPVENMMLASKKLKEDEDRKAKTPVTTALNIAGPRALLQYIVQPDRFPRSIVVKWTDDFVLIKDRLFVFHLC